MYKKSYDIEKANISIKSLLGVKTKKLIEAMI